MISNRLENISKHSQLWFLQHSFYPHRAWKHRFMTVFSTFSPTLDVECLYWGCLAQFSVTPCSGKIYNKLTIVYKPHKVVYFRKIVLGQLESQNIRTNRVVVICLQTIAQTQVQTNSGSLLPIPVWCILYICFRDRRLFAKQRESMHCGESSGTRIFPSDFVRCFS